MVENSAATWKNDWTCFVKSVANDFAAGLSASEVSVKYSSTLVEWIGTVLEAELADDVPAVKMQMPAVPVEMPDGRHGVVDYLALLIDEKDVVSWSQVAVGEVVKCRTFIRQGNGPFPGLDWVDLGNKEGYLSIGTFKSSFIQTVNE